MSLTTRKAEVVHLSFASSPKPWSVAAISTSGLKVRKNRWTFNGITIVGNTHEADCDLGKGTAHQQDVNLATLAAAREQITLTVMFNDGSTADLLVNLIS
jgi:hypothetical protein